MNLKRKAKLSEAKALIASTTEAMAKALQILNEVQAAEQTEYDEMRPAIKLTDRGINSDFALRALKDLTRDMESYDPATAVSTLQDIIEGQV